MNKIQELLTEISALELEAGQIDPSDKETLYSVLVKAYSKSKDVIVLLQETVPEPIKVVDTDKVDQLQFELNKMTQLKVMADEQLEAIQKIVVPGLV